MKYEDFQSIIKSFCDSPESFQKERNDLVFQSFDETYEITLSFDEEENVRVQESDAPTLSGRDWIAKRLAHLELLAERLIEKLNKEPYFIPPKGQFLDALYNNPEENIENVADVPKKILDVLTKRIAGNSFVLYLTSDAGEGKTTVINKVAIQQAQLYIKKESKKLIVPIALGGRTFLGLDDVIVATLVNQLKFRYLDFNCFLELVKHGFIILALDGFEEMFVEKGAGDAISSLGHLLQRVKNKGNFLIAARKAYFEYQRVSTQAKLFDSLKGTSVIFSKLAVSRWDHSDFQIYCNKRKFDSEKPKFKEFIESLGKDHPFITRPVLVKRIIDLAEEGRSLDVLQETGNDPFTNLVNSILIREVEQKWLTKGQDAAQTLLSLDGHHELLEQIATEMWLTRTENLSTDTLDIVSAMFCEEREFDPSTSRQILERTKQHPLLRNIGFGANKYSFDHPEFYNFFLGKAVAKKICGKNNIDICHALRQSDLPEFSIESAIRHLRKLGGSTDIIKLLNELSLLESITSFVSENCGSLIAGLIDLSEELLNLKSIVFPANALEHKKFSNICFNDCFFGTTKFPSTISESRFIYCEFEYLEIGSQIHRGIYFKDCKIGALKTDTHKPTLYSPSHVYSALIRFGFTVDNGKNATFDKTSQLEPDIETQLFERSIRAFVRLTEVNENVFRAKLGKNSNIFINDVLPRLVRHNVFHEVEYRGSGKQRRFKLSVSLGHIQKMLQKAEGVFQSFLDSM